MIQFLRGTKSQLEASNTIFGAGQPIFESDTGQLKIGNGSGNFASLPYVGASSGGSLSGSYHVVDPRTAYIDVTENYRICIRRNLTTVDQDFLNNLKQNGKLTIQYEDGSGQLIYYTNTSINSSASTPISTNTALKPYLYDKAFHADIQVGVWGGKYNFDDSHTQLVSQLGSGRLKVMPYNFIYQFDNEDPDVLNSIQYQWLLSIEDSVTLPGYFCVTVITHTCKSSS